MPSVESRITDVTVYTNQALVIRKGMVTLTGEERELIIENLPLSVQPDSIRANGVGTIGVKLLGVRIDHEYTVEPTNEKIAEFQNQIKALDEQISLLSNKTNSLRLQQSFVLGLGEKSLDKFAQGLSRQQISITNLEDLLAFIGNHSKDYGAEQIQLNKEMAELQQQKQVISQQIAKLNNPRPTESYKVSVAIEPSGAGEFELEISYTINNTSWQPLYDLRVSLESKKVRLSYLAEVRQTSGEDWKNVRLTLSTAKPGLGTLPPKPQPWYIDIYRPTPSSSLARAKNSPIARGAFSDSPSTDDFDFALPEYALAGAVANASPPPPPPAPMEAQAATAEISREGGIVTFRLESDSDIPSDGAPHKTTIFSDDYPCQFEYVAMPRLVSFTYLQAVVTNSTRGATLLPGKANVFRSNAFVGTSQLANVAPNEEFKVNLGIDESVKIERELIEREVDKRFLGNQRRITYGYRLSITNLQTQEVTLRLSEQIPVSRNEQIKIKLNRSTPAISVGEMGVLEWVLPLTPKLKREVYYQFAVEYGAELNLTGLNI